MAYGFVKYVYEKIFWIEGNMPISLKLRSSMSLFVSVSGHLSVLSISCRPHKNWNSHRQISFAHEFY